MNFTKIKKGYSETEEWVVELDRKAHNNKECRKGEIIMSNWNEVKKNITALSQEEWDEVDLKVKIVGEISEARKKAGLTQTELENLTGIKQTFIARFENNRMDSQLTTVLKLLRPLGLTLDVVPLNSEH